MAFGLGTALAIAPYAIQAGGWLANKWQTSRPGYQKASALKRAGITPEQYDLRKQELEQGLAMSQDPQQLFLPRQAQMQQGQDFTQGLPQQVGQQQQPQYAGGLASILSRMGQSARSGYDSDIAGIGAMRGPSRNPRGRSSGMQAMMRQAMIGRQTGFLQDRFQLLSDFANRNAMSEIESGALNVQRGGAQNRLQNFLADMKRRQQGMGQEQYLGQQQYNINQAGMRNILGSEQQRQGSRRFNIGQRDQYITQQAPQGI